MRLVPVVVVGSLMLAACDGFLHPSGSVTYKLANCTPAYQSGPAAQLPCLTFSSPSIPRSVTDSGRLILNEDGTAHWMLATTTTLNSCYLSQQSCPTTTFGIDSAAGSYRVGHDSIVVELVFPHYTTSLVFLGRWIPLDSLTLDLGGNTRYLGVFKPQATIR